MLQTLEDWALISSVDEHLEFLVSELPHFQRCNDGYTALKQV
jgi:hypothetical protein